VSARNRPSDVEAAEGIAMDKAGGSNRLQFSRNPLNIAMHHATFPCGSCCR
jgi:hypothetical protein